jgi:mannose-6-phosphate isomerase-like protein (cupin superfamily)
LKVRSIYAIPNTPVHNGTVSQWKIFTEDDFQSSMNIFNANILSPGVEMEPHQHESEEQMYFILGGTGTVKVGNEIRDVREGDVIYLTPKLPHTMKNTGTYPLRFLAIGAKIK